MVINKFGWLIKKKGKENERILPWNHQEIVDVQETAAQFIKKIDKLLYIFANRKSNASKIINMFYV